MDILEYSTMFLIYIAVILIVVFILTMQDYRRCQKRDKLLDGMVINTQTMLAKEQYLIKLEIKQEFQEEVDKMNRTYGMG